MQVYIKSISGLFQLREEEVKDTANTVDVQVMDKMEGKRVKKTTHAFSVTALNDNI